MLSDRHRIEAVLRNGETIFLQRSELREIPLQELLNLLDDGTTEMLRNRWGVLAQAIIASIPSWEMKALVKYLEEVDCPHLACEYVGYALQSVHGVILEELLIEADGCKCFDKIAKYVSSNLQYIKNLHLHLVNPFLVMIEKYRDFSAYYDILRCYAKGIAACDGCLAVITEIMPISREVQYQLTYNLRRYWFENKPDEASNQICVFLSQNTMWAWKAAMDYCEWSVPSDNTILEKYYLQITELVDKYDELKRYGISLLVEYIVQTSQEKEKHVQYPIIISKLKLLVKQTPAGKDSFLQKIEYLNDYPIDLYEIFQDLLCIPFSNNSDTLKHLDNCFSSMLAKKDYRLVLDNMFICFSVNEYHSKFGAFFDALDSTIYALSRFANQITDLALAYIMTSNSDKLFFGLGLLDKLGNVKGMYDQKKGEDLSFAGSYDENQLIQVMKAVLFFTADENRISHYAFSLLYLAKGTTHKYLQFCMESVFYDYPIKMYEVSERYAQTCLPIQAELAVLVKQAYVSMVELQRQVRDIPDLDPSHEHERIYRCAQMEQSREISKKANEGSFLFNFFAHKVLKYGKRSGHVINGRNNEQFYQSSPYQELRYKQHLPTTYVVDPVEYSMRKYNFLQEVKERATNN